MTQVVELRDLKKGLARPVSCCWQRSLQLLCALRFRAACFALLSVTLAFPIESGVATRGGALVTVCDLLTAAVSATFALLCDAISALSALLIDHANPLFGLAERLSPCLGEPFLPFETCPAAGPFPTFSGARLCALAACALLLCGCNYGRREAAGPDARPRKP